MDFDLPADDDPRRLALRKWLAEHPKPTQPQLAEAGLVAPHWPAPWGLDADVEHQLIIDAELKAARVEMPGVSIAVGWAGPTILSGGTDEQAKRWLPSMLDGTSEWSQLFSEPDSGSDLASLRTSAVRDGDEYIVNGQKIWSTWADTAEWGILLARTSTEGRKQEGISYFVVDMKTPGIDVRKIVEMTGGNHFNETWFDDVRIPVKNRIGPENGGWRLAKVTLGNERLSLSEGGVIWGMGPTSDEFFESVRGTIDDPLLRQKAASVYTEKRILELIGYRMMTMALGGQDPGPFASIRKALSDEHGQTITSLAKDLQGAAAMCGIQNADAEHLDLWHWSYLFSRALTIGGGTSEVQRNIIGEHLLGLPRS